MIASLAGCGAASLAAPAATRDNPLASPPSDTIDTAEWPTAAQVARRTLLLCALAARGFLDSEQPADAEELREELIRFVVRNGLEAELEPAEAALLAAPVGGLERQSMIDATWRLEGMVVLAWALGATDLPAHDETADGLRLCVSLGLMSDETPLLLQMPQRRPAEHIARLQGQLLGIHWRMVDYRAQPAPLDFRAVASRNWSGEWDLAGIPLVDDDLAIRGVRVDVADPSARSETESIARERHRAINWLSGAHPLYSRVPTDT